MKRIVFKFLLLCFPLSILGQTLKLDSCQQNARLNYPLIKQFDLIDKTSDYNLSNASKAYLPQMNLSARATYQSNVTSLPINIPNVVIPALSKDQYQAAIELSQLIWDGGATGSVKKSLRAQAESERQKVEVDLYAISDRVNQMFFSVLLLNEQLKLNLILQDELTVNYKRIEVLKQNGMANQTDLDIVSVERINAKQRQADLQSTRKSFVDMLEALTAIKINESTVFEKPLIPNIDYVPTIKRPELLFFEAQSQLVESQRDIVTASNLPKLGLFVKGGYGKPALNMLSNNFEAFYIGGLNLSWNLSGFYTQKSNFAKINVSKKMIDVQKETFLFNNDLQNKQSKNEIEKLKQLLRDDDEMIVLRTNIKKATEVKVEFGTATITDLLRELNAENRAIQAKSMHEIQLYMASYQYKYNTNN
jgi:outer membrane protein TolC